MKTKRIRRTRATAAGEPHALPPAKPRANVGEDRLLGGSLIIRQPKRGHRAGTDAVLLASAVPASQAKTIVDLGSGVGTVGLIVAARFPKTRLTLVDNDPALVALARDNIVLNGFQRRMQAIQADVFAAAQARRERGLPSASFDCVVTNPPWLDERRFRGSPDALRSGAHVLRAGTLDDWVCTAADLLVPRGELLLIHRAESLPQLIAALEGRFGAIVLRSVQPREGARATRLIVRATKGSRAPLNIEPPLVVHGADNRFTPEVEALHRELAADFWSDDRTSACAARRAGSSRA